MTFSLWKLGLGLTVIKILSCLFVDTQNLFVHLFVQNYKYSRTLMARTPLGPWKLVRDRGSSSQ